MSKSKGVINELSRNSLKKLLNTRQDNKLSLCGHIMCDGKYRIFTFVYNIVVE